MIKKENGITLITLVITIIILIMLAGIAVLNVDVFSQARTAKKSQEIGDCKQELTLILLENQIDNYDKPDKIAIVKTNIMTQINKTEKYDIEDKSPNMYTLELKVTTKDGNYSFKITDKDVIYIQDAE